MEETTEKPSKYEDLGAAELMIVFWFGIGVIIAATMAYSLEYCIEEPISKKSGYCQ